VKSLVARKRFDEAKTDIDRFLLRYPSSAAHDEALSLKKTIEERLNDRSAAAFTLPDHSFAVQR